MILAPCENTGKLAGGPSERVMRTKASAEREAITAGVQGPLKGPGSSGVSRCSLVHFELKLTPFFMIFLVKFLPFVFRKKNSHLDKMSFKILKNLSPLQHLFNILENRELKMYICAHVININTCIQLYLGGGTPGHDLV